MTLLLIQCKYSINQNEIVNIAKKAKLHEVYESTGESLATLLTHGYLAKFTTEEERMMTRRKALQKRII